MSTIPLPGWRSAPRPSRLGGRNAGRGPGRPDRRSDRGPSADISNLAAAPSNRGRDPRPCCAAPATQPFYNATPDRGVAIERTDVVRGSDLMAELDEAKRFAHGWLDRERQRLSDFDLEIWRYAEPAWRE